MDPEEHLESTEPVEADFLPPLPEPDTQPEAEPEAEPAQVDGEPPAQDPEFVMSPSSSSSSTSDSSSVVALEKRKQPSRLPSTSKKLRADPHAESSRPPRAAKVLGQRMLTASVQSDLRHEKRRSEKKASADETAVRSKRARKVFAPSAPSVENAKLNYQFSTLHEVLS
jgi:hypothetical protein